MKNEKETKSKLLASAKAEFLEKGYLQASLRNICKNAGVTTGALYFFFQGKEDIFAALVEEPLQKLQLMMKKHYEDEIDQVVDEKNMKEDFSEDLEVASAILHFMYQYFDEFQLILTKSQGSRFENAADQFVEFTEKHYRIYLDYVSESNGYERLDDYLVHWIAHMHIDIFIHMLMHERSEEKAQKNLKATIAYIVGGWEYIFKDDTNIKL